MGSTYKHLGGKNKEINKENVEGGKRKGQRKLNSHTPALKYRNPTHSANLHLPKIVEDNI